MVTPLPVPRTAQAPTGAGRARAHHGELLQGAFKENGRTRRGLITLPCNLFSSDVTFDPAPVGSVLVDPVAKTKARRAAELTLAALDVGHCGGHLRIRSTVPPGRGFGSSTSDVLATIWAVADAFGRAVSDAFAARLAVRAELASDPLMFNDRPLLFAHREGEVLEDFGHHLPGLDVIGFGTGDDGVDTLSLPPARYTRHEIETFDRLRLLMRKALRTRDAALLGNIATTSALINLNHLPNDLLDTIFPVLDRTGAVGLQVAHSGNIAGLLFDNSRPDNQHRQRLAHSLLTDIGITKTWGFTVGR